MLKNSITPKNLSLFSTMDIFTEYAYEIKVHDKTYYVPVGYEVDLPEIKIQTKLLDQNAGPTLIGTDWCPVYRDLPRSAHSFFWKLARNMDPKNNIAQYIAKDINESKWITKAYKVLSQKNLVKRIKRQHYMINPTAIIPALTYDTVLEHWHTII